MRSLKILNGVLVPAVLLISTPGMAEVACKLNGKIHSQPMVFMSDVRLGGCPTTIAFEPGDHALTVWTLALVTRYNGTCHYVMPIAAGTSQMGCTGLAEQRP